VGEARWRGAKSLEQLDLRRGVGDVVVAADHMGDAQVDIIDDGWQRVEIAAVGAHQDGIALARLVDVLRAAREVVPTHVLAMEQEAPMRPAAFGLEPAAVSLGQRESRPVVDRRQMPLLLALALEVEFLRRLVAGIETFVRLERLDRRGIERVALGLAGALIPHKAEPAQVRLDAGREFGGRALAVGVVEAQHEDATLLAREEPVGEGDVDVADMQPAGRARREADADPHPQPPRKALVMG